MATQCSTYKVSAVKCGVHLQFTNQDFKNVRMSPTASKDEGIATILQEDRKDRGVGREGRGGEGGRESVEIWRVSRQEEGKIVAQRFLN